MVFGKSYDKLTDEQKLELWNKELEDDMARWEYINENGCSDPFWPDGVNMNLKRNHIINDLYMIAELDKKPRQITFVDLLGSVACSPVDFRNDPRIPKEVPQDYMVKPRRCTYFEVGNCKEETLDEAKCK